MTYPLPTPYPLTTRHHTHYALAGAFAPAGPDLKAARPDFEAAGPGLEAARPDFEAVGPDFQTRRPHPGRNPGRYVSNAFSERVRSAVSAAYPRITPRYPWGPWGALLMPFGTPWPWGHLGPRCAVGMCEAQFTLVYDAMG